MPPTYSNCPPTQKQSTSTHLLIEEYDYVFYESEIQAKLEAEYDILEILKII